MQGTTGPVPKAWTGSSEASTLGGRTGTSAAGAAAARGPRMPSLGTRAATSGGAAETSAPSVASTGGGDVTNAGGTKRSACSVGEDPYHVGPVNAYEYGPGERAAASSTGLCV
jgi:hypothetical protein